MNRLIDPSFRMSMDSPALNVPQHGPVRFRPLAVQFPAVEFMAHKPLTFLNNRTVLPCLQLAIANLQGASLGGERQDPCHGVAVAIHVVQLVAEKEHAAAFGINRPTSSELAQRLQAALALADLGRVLLWKSPWQDQTSRLSWDGLVGERAPTDHRHAHVLQKLICFWVAEVKGGITGESHRQGIPIHRWDVGQGGWSLLGCLKKGFQTCHIQMLAGESGPGLASFCGGRQLMGRG